MATSSPIPARFSYRRARPTHLKYRASSPSRCRQHPDGRHRARRPPGAGVRCTAVLRRDVLPATGRGCLEAIVGPARRQALRRAACGVRAARMFVREARLDGGGRSLQRLDMDAGTVALGAPGAGQGDSAGGLVSAGRPAPGGSDRRCSNRARARGTSTLEPCCSNAAKKCAACGTARQTALEDGGPIDRAASKCFHGMMLRDHHESS